MTEKYNFVFKTPQGVYTSQDITKGEVEQYGTKVVEFLNADGVAGYLRFTTDANGSSVFIPLALLRQSIIEIVVKKSA